MTVIQTGSIALLAFVFADYAAELAGTDTRLTPLYAALAVVALTAVNVRGVREGKWTQNVLTIIEVAGVLAVIIAGLALVAPAAGPSEPRSATGAAAPGLALIFVLLTYGGWNEAAFISAEVRHPQRNMPRALLLSLCLVTALYVLANVAYLRGLGLTGMAGSDTVAADLMRRAVGPGASVALSLLVAISALSSANATVITGARTTFHWVATSAPPRAGAGGSAALRPATHSSFRGRLHSC